MRNHVDIHAPFPPPANPTRNAPRPAARPRHEPRRANAACRARCLVYALLAPVLAWAQAAPAPHIDAPRAGQALRDIETPRPTVPAPAQPDLDLPPAAPAGDASDEGPRVAVRRFALSGNQHVDAAPLQALLADLVGRELSFAQLRAAAARITDYYRAHGYVLARAYLPQQEVADGEVRIAVVEGRYGRIELHNRSRVRDAVLRQPLGPLRADTLVQGADLERSLMLLDELPGVEARGTLRAGAEPGTTDLLIDAERGPFATGGLEFDNFGEWQTGRYRFSASVDVNTPLGLGDQLTLRGLTSERSQRYYRAAYQLPIGPASTRLGVGYSNMRYRIGGPLEELGIYGRANVQSVFVTQPLLRSRRTSLNAQILYENKNLHDGFRAFDILTDKNVGLWSFSLSGRSEDGWLGGGRSGFSATLGVGRLRSNDPLGTSRRANTPGRFARLNLSALRLQALGARLQLYTQFSAQLASRNLDASEKFSVGGPYGVRAYALGASGGDQGWQATAELRYLAAPGWQVSTFVDTGRTQIDKQPLSDDLNTFQLSSVGVGLSWYGAKRQLSVTAALPLGNEHAALSRRSPGVWLQAAQYF